MGNWSSNPDMKGWPGDRVDGQVDTHVTQNEPATTSPERPFEEGLRGRSDAAERPEPVKLERPDLPQGYASEHWDRVHPLLSEMGVLHPVDRPALESLS